MRRADAMSPTVFARAELPDTCDALTEVERVELARLGLDGARRAQWIAGRAAVRRVLGAHGNGISVLCDARGAPYTDREGVSVSLSHDGPWVAVATASSGTVAVDLCSHAHARRAERVVERLGITGVDPCVAWAALETALKLRGLGVTTLLDGGLAITLDGERARVTGLGADADITWRAEHAYTLAWGHE